MEHLGLSLTFCGFALFGYHSTRSLDHSYGKPVFFNHGETAMDEAQPRSGGCAAFAATDLHESCASGDSRADSK